jgi:ribose transport system permease protein
VSESSGTEVAPSARASRSGLHAAIGRALFSTRFVTIWLALGALLVVCRIVAPETLSSASWSTLLPTGSIVAVVALGQMAVIMMGGIDLSMGATISLLANVLVGVAKGQDDRLPQAILVVLILGIIIGLVNGLLVAVLELNPLIVTLSTGLILLGITAEYRSSSTSNTMVPTSLSDAVFDKVFGISKAFWFVFVVMLLVAFILRSSTGGRRFQAVGANRRVAWMAGIHVRAYVVLAYVAASIAAGVAGLVLSAIVVSPGVDPGASYLLGPVAAVVLGGAAQAGGRASPASTWAAAFFITILNQLLRILGLSNAWQYVVFGLAIVLGMVISGDRIAALIGRLLLQPRVRRFFAASEGSDQLPLEPQASAG